MDLTDIYGLPVNVEQIRRDERNDFILEFMKSNLFLP
jgi:hypothetical protein